MGRVENIKLFFKIFWQEIKDAIRERRGGYF